MNRVYLDYAATTPLDKEVLAEMVRVYEKFYGNPSSFHTIGLEAGSILKQSRETIARILAARPKEIVFTGGGTAADNLAIKGVAFKNRRRGKHLITSAIEHPAVKNTVKYLEEEHDFRATVLPVDNYGLIRLNELEAAISGDTTLVSIMYANNEIGTIQPVKEIGKICKDRDVIFHTDAVQAFCKVPIDVDDCNIDLLSIAAHKIHGPKGVGALFVRNGGNRSKWGRYIEPLLHGGGHENGLRAGTENVPGIAGLAKAAEIMAQAMPEEMTRQTQLRDKIIQFILERIPDSFLNGHPTQRLPNNVNVGIKYIEGESILLRLDQEGIAVSTGSACSSKSLEPSHVLLATGLPHEFAHGSLRVTIGRCTTEDEVALFLEKIGPIAQVLRNLSPLTPDNLRT